LSAISSPETAISGTVCANVTAVQRLPARTSSASSTGRRQ
jgi:hypothetical protein